MIDTRDSYYIAYTLIKLPINDLLLKILLLFAHLFNKNTIHFVFGFCTFKLKELPIH